MTDSSSLFPDSECALPGRESTVTDSSSTFPDSSIALPAQAMRGPPSFELPRCVFSFEVPGLVLEMRRLETGSVLVMPHARRRVKVVSWLFLELDFRRLPDRCRPEVIGQSVRMRADAGANDLGSINVLQCMCLCEPAQPRRHRSHPAAEQKQARWFRRRGRGKDRIAVEVEQLTRRDVRL